MNKGRTYGTTDTQGTSIPVPNKINDDAREVYHEHTPSFYKQYTRIFVYLPIVLWLVQGSIL